MVVSIRLVRITVRSLVSDLLAEIIELALTIKYVFLILLDNHFISFALRRFAVVIIDGAYRKTYRNTDRSSKKGAHRDITISDEGTNYGAGASSRRGPAN
jgi:hypothetical protein